MITTKEMLANGSNGNGSNVNVPTSNGLAVRPLALGIGAGMLLATLIIGIGAQFQNQTTANASNSQTVGTSDWKQAAAQSGMVVLTKQDWNKQLADAKAAGAEQKASELAQQQPKTVHVYIQPGMGTTDVAMLLQAAGVLQDGNALIALRQAQANPIRSGVYDLPLHADPHAILQAISTPPKY